MQDKSINFLQILLSTIGMMCIPLLSWSQVTGTKEEASLQEKMIEAKQLALLGNYDKAIVAFEELHSQTNGIPSISYELSRLYAIEGPASNAVKYAKEAYEKNPNNPWFTSFYGKLLKENNLHYEAIQFLEALISREPDQPNHYAQLSHHLNALGSTEKAVETLEKYANIAGWNYELYELSLSFAQQYEKPKNIEKRLLEITVLKEDNPQYLYLLADFYAQSGNKKRERETYENILQKFPNETKAKLALIIDLEEIESSNKIIATLQPIIQDPSIGLDPKIKALIPYVNDLIENPSTQITEDLLGLVDMLKKQYSNQGKIFSIEGDLFALHGDFDNAIKAYKKATELNPEIFTLWNALLDAYYQTKQFDLMKASASKALSFFPFQYKVYYQLAIACFFLNELEKAQSNIDLGRTLTEPESISNAMFIALEGDILFKLNNKAEALVKWKEALKLGYKDPNLLEKIKSNE